MKLKFKVFGGLREQFAHITKQDWIEFEAGMTLGDFLSQYEFPPKAYWMAAVNKTLVRDDYKLKDGDIVDIFPPIAGGC